ncbi:MAG: hypothetical protein ABIJ21_07810 [Nanoarchaeota archaeon]
MKQGEINIDVLVRNLGHERDFNNRVDWTARVAEKAVLEGNPEQYVQNIRDQFYKDMGRWVEHRLLDEEDADYEKIMPDEIPEQRYERHTSLRIRPEQSVLALYAADYTEEIYRARVLELMGKQTDLLRSGQS